MPTSTLAGALAALALLAPPAAALAGDERIAVLEFGGKGDPALLAQLADEVRSVAADELRGRYVVMTREAMALVLKQMGAVCTEGDCEVETARNVGAALVATGELRRIGKTLVLGLKLHETAKGALLAAETVRATDPMKLLDGCREAAKALLRRALPVAPAPAVASQGAVPAAVPAAHAAGTAPVPAAHAAATAPVSAATAPGQSLEQAIPQIRAAANRAFQYRDLVVGAHCTSYQRVEFSGCRVKLTERTVHQAGLDCTSTRDFELRDIGDVATRAGSDHSWDRGSATFVDLTTTMLEKRVQYEGRCNGGDPSVNTYDKATVWTSSEGDAERVAGLFRQLVASCGGAN